MLLARVALVVQLFGADNPTAAGPDADRRCLECHGVGDLVSLDRFTGREYRLAIDVEGYRASSHKDLRCAACHERGYDQIPHRNARRRDAFACLFCHRDDDALRGADVEKRRAAVKESVHWEKVGSLFDCHACHDPHTYRAPPTPFVGRARIAWANAICARCHVERPLVPFEKAKRAVGGHAFFPHEDLHLEVTACIDCHGEERQLRHRVLPAKEATRDCASCHGGSARTLTASYGSSPSRDHQTGVTNRDALDEVYVIGSTKSRTLDRVSIAAFLLFVGLIALHALLRLIVYRGWR